ncbi:alpha/beta fold hydrolase [Mucilaginibacter sp. OK098]|uniref:alpha/beta fold hydrolase n=1 Tax=Mucilaginibacter sp. OK098 TaxID=1855297 RepID=UPI00091B6D29|nr:alpha/beta hydrolase [Mucilaginibacter sp. OK098]SHN11173.1 Pimeloyl-ACP methyl ester carboxylesterase [Mucilaginibacter sp. OK098]
MNTVISKDGTKIAYNQNGSGPVIILVDGAFCSKDFGPMTGIVPLLSKNFTVISYDRRARGESGDTKPYAVEREIEDINALINVSGGSASLFGISSGAILCIKAVAYGLNIHKLAILEPPFVGNKDNKRPADAVQQLNQMIAVGEQGSAVKFYLRKVIGLPAIIVFILRLTPNWPKMKAIANSLPYDAAVCGDFNMPKEQVSCITIPTIAIDSKQSPTFLRDAVQGVASALTNGKRVSLKGKPHDVPPKILVPALTDFYNS